MKGERKESRYTVSECQGQDKGRREAASACGLGKRMTALPSPPEVGFLHGKCWGRGIRGGGGFPEGVGKPGGIRKGRNGLERKEQQHSRRLHSH